VQKCRRIEHLTRMYIDSYRHRYGRFSKSIRPDECGMSTVHDTDSGLIQRDIHRAVCGACKVGKLVPLFAQAAPKTPKTKANSRMAAEKTQGWSFAFLRYQKSLILYAHRITILCCSTSTSLGQWRKDDHLSPNTWTGAESIFCRYPRF
jgi:hypothetical protein